MRQITEIIIHCSATPEGRNIGAATIRRWHIDRGFQDIGYHYVVRLNGTIETGRPVEQIGAHCKNHNRNSIGICYVGGTDRNGKSKDTRTPEQRQALTQLCLQLLRQFPGATIHGHNEYAAKACPSFNVKEEFGDPNTNQRSVCGGESGGNGRTHQLAERFGHCEPFAERDRKEVKL